MNNSKKESLKRQLRRLIISHYDLECAKEYAINLLFHELNKLNNKQDDLLKGAYTVSLIVSYFRPFSGNKNGDLPNSALKKLSEEEKDLHKKIAGKKGLRNIIHAHSDLYEHDLKIKIKQIKGIKFALPAKAHPYSISINQIITLLGMIKKIQDIIAEKQATLQNEFDENEII